MGGGGGEWLVGGWWGKPPDHPLLLLQKLSFHGITIIARMTVVNNLMSLERMDKLKRQKVKSSRKEDTCYK